MSKTSARLSINVYVECPSCEAIECEPVAWLTSKGEEKEVIFDSEYDRNDRNHDEKRGWKYDPLFTHAQSAECDCCGYPGHDLPKWRKILREAAQPASAAPDEEYLRALQDACDIIQADANTEENYGSLCRIGSVLGKLKDTPTNADVWIKCSDRLPNLGQRVILKSRGVVQNYMPVFDQGDDDRGMGDHFWDFEDVNKIDNPLVDFEKDCWMPKPKQEQDDE